MDVLALPAWDALRPCLPYASHGDKAGCEHAHFMKGCRKRFRHYRRSRTNKAPRKRTFIMNMTKYPATLISSVAKGHFGVGSGGNFGGTSISHKQQSGTGSGGAGQDRQPGLVRAHRLFRLPNVSYGNIGVLLGALAMKPYLDAAASAASLVTMTAALWMLQHSEQQMLEMQQRQWRERLAKRTTKPFPLSRAKTTASASTIRTAGVKRQAGAASPLPAHRTTVAPASRPEKKARTNSSLQSPFAAAISELPPTAASNPALAHTAASASPTSQDSWPKHSLNSMPSVSSFSSLASQSSESSAFQPTPATGPSLSPPSLSPAPSSPSQGTSELHMEQRIGGGAHGSVFLATWEGAPVAVKVAASVDQQVLNSFQREVNMLSSLQHENIIKLLHSSAHSVAHATTPTLPSDAFLVEEYAELGDIGAVMHSADPTQLQQLLTNILALRMEPHASRARAQPAAEDAMEVDVNNDPEASSPASVAGAAASMIAQCVEPAELKRLVLLYLLKDVASALHHIHTLDRPIIHRDLKPENILISSDGTAKLADFGVAVRHDANTTPAAAADVFGTPQYSAPEDLWATEYQLSTKADMFSFGYLLWEVLSGQRPWQGVDGCSVVYCVGLNGERLAMDLAWPEQLRKLVSKCWETDPSTRPSAADAAAILEAEIEAMVSRIAPKP